MPGTVAITFSDAAGRDSAVSAGTPLPVTAGGATPAGQTPPASEAPVPIGGRYNLTSPTLPDGARGEAQMDARGNLLFALRDAGGTGSAQVGVPTDAFSNANGGLTGNARGLVFNGTTWDRTRGDVRGTLMQRHFTASRWNFVASGSATITASSTAEVTIIAAAGAGVRNFLLGLQIDFNAMTTTQNLEFRDGPSGPALYRMRVLAGTYHRPIVLPLDGIMTSANTALIVVMPVADTGTIFINAQGGQG